MEMVMPVILQLVKFCIIGFVLAPRGSAGLDTLPSPEILPPNSQVEGLPGPAQQWSPLGSDATSPAVNTIEPDRSPSAAPSSPISGGNGAPVAAPPAGKPELIPPPPVNHSPIKDPEVSPALAPPPIITGPIYGTPLASPPDRAPGPVSHTPVNNSRSEEPGISPSLAPHPGVVWKRNGMPIAAPPSEKPEPTPPADNSPVGEHNISPAPSSAKKGGEMPMLSPPSRIPESPPHIPSPPKEPVNSPASPPSPSTSPKRGGIPFAAPPSKTSEPTQPVIQAPRKEPHIISPASSPPPSITWKRDGMPMAPPPKESSKPKPPVQHPPIKEPDKSPPTPSNPPPSIDQRRDSSPSAAPSDKHPDTEHVNHYPRRGSTPAVAPSTHKDWRQPNVATVPPPFSSQVPSDDGYLSPKASPSTLHNKHGHQRNKIISPVPMPSKPAFPPPSKQKGAVAPPVSPTEHSWKRHAHPHHQPGPSATPPQFPFPSPINHKSPAPSPNPEATSDQSKKPFLPPKVNNPSGSLSRTPKAPQLPTLHIFPPPPPNEDCSSTICTEPYTNSPPGAPCACVLPMQVGLRLGVDLYTFFPLVSDLAAEVAAGVFMKQSQVRIMGANAANQQLEKTIVLIDLVPLGSNFDKTTALLTFQRFWHKQVAIKASLFGDYDVLYVHYPGLPPSPPMAPSDINIIDGGPYSGNGNNGRTIKPLGVDVPKRKHKDNISGGVVAIIVLSAIVAVILCSTAAWAFLFKHKEQSSQPEQPPQALPSSITKTSAAGGSMVGSGPSSASLSFGSSMAAYTGSAKTFSTGDIEKATDNFNPSRILGEGGFGRVYSGTLEDGTVVAVKVLKRDDQQGGREFLAEIEMLSRLHHRNLVKLIGICIEERNRCLVYELIPNGSVESHLHGVDKETSPLDWAARIKIALGAARGLAYLHEDSSPRVIHRDFKSSNILLEDDFTPKVSDFGLARTALDEENRHISTRVMGTFGYVAPEYAMTGHLLVKSDVYSYGVVLLELLTGRKPVDMSQPPGEENLVAWARPLLTSREGLEAIIDPSLVPEVPFDSVAKVAAIASMCVQPEVSHRPFMGEVVQALKLVCNECDEAREMGSSQDDISIDSEARMSCSSEPLPNHMPSEYSLSHLESAYDAQHGISMTELLSASARLEGRDSESFRRHSSSGPLRTGRGREFWQRVRRLSGGSLSEHGATLRFWPGSH